MGATFRQLLTGILAASLVVSFASGLFAQITPIDENTVWVQAQGRAEKDGDSHKREKEARDNAKRNAINLLVNAILTDQQEREAYRAIEDQFLADFEQYILDVIPERKYIDARRLVMGLKLKVNKDLVRQRLVDFGVITSAKESRIALDRFTIMPYLDEEASSSEALQWKDLFYTRFRAFFEDQGIPTIGYDEVMATEGDEEILAKAKSSTADSDEEDLALQIARNTPADIYVKIVARIEHGQYRGNNVDKVILTVGAYNVMTGEFIGSGEGFSEPMSLSSSGTTIAAGIDQAMNAAMNSVMDRITSFWRDFVRHGRPVKLIFTDFSFGERGQIKQMLERITNDQKLMKQAGNVTEYMVWYDGDVQDLMYKVYEEGQFEGKLAEDPSLISNTIRFYRKTE